jgi:hypothetical protein
MPDEPKNIGDIEWISYRYRDISEDDLFWPRQSLDRDNLPLRKINDTTALNLRDMSEVPIDPNMMVHQKEW